MDRDQLIIALDNMERMFIRWDRWNVDQRTRDGLSTADDTHVMAVPPTWPTHGAVRQWAEVMREARKAISQD